MENVNNLKKEINTLISINLLLKDIESIDNLEIIEKLNIQIEKLTQKIDIIQGKEK